MAYGFGSTQVPYDVLLVLDLGGGTLDVTVVEVFEGIMEVRQLWWGGEGGREGGRQERNCGVTP